MGARRKLALKLAGTDPRVQRIAALLPYVRRSLAVLHIAGITDRSHAEDIAILIDGADPALADRVSTLAAAGDLAWQTEVTQALWRLRRVRPECLWPTITRRHYFRILQTGMPNSDHVSLAHAADRASTGERRRVTWEIVAKLRARGEPVPQPLHNDDHGGVGPGTPPRCLIPAPPANRWKGGGTSEADRALELEQHAARTSAEAAQAKIAAERRAIREAAAERERFEAARAASMTVASEGGDDVVQAE